MDRSSPADGLQQKQSLLRLPIEIRIQIWRSLVVSPALIKPRHRERFIVKSMAAVRMRKKRLKYYQQRKPTSLTPAFTCRAIYQEVTSIYYSENPFDLCINISNFRTPTKSQSPGHWHPTISAFATAIGAVNFAHIRNIQVDCSDIFERAPAHLPVQFRRIGDFSILQRSVKGIKDTFRDDVKLIPFHRDSDLMDIVTRQFERALRHMRKMPYWPGSNQLPIFVD